MIQFLTQPPSQQQDLLFGPPPPGASEMGTRRGSTQYNGSPAWRVGGGGFAPKRTARGPRIHEFELEIDLLVSPGSQCGPKRYF